MRVRYEAKAGILSVIAGVLLLAAPNVVAAEKPSVSGTSMELKAKSAVPMNLNVRDLDEEVSHLEVVDSKGNAYLLIPLRTTGGNKPVTTEDGKIIVEYVHPYSGRLGN